MFEKTLPDSGTKVRGVEYDVEDYLKSCIERYKELTGVTTLRKAATPFLPEPTRPDFSHTEAGPQLEPTPDEALDAVVFGLAEGGAEGGRNCTAHNTLTTNNDEHDSERDVPTQLAPYAAKVLNENPLRRTIRTI